ncbi:MAG: PD40 domain-containing protein [Deltaproteobacteria bacterium]|nr:PD40 domain-containing protein [Deltaproteobacteria bacterium]
MSAPVRSGSPAFWPALALAFALLALVAAGCECAPERVHPCLGQVPARSAAIPADVVKGTPASDFFPPLLRSAEFEDPVPWASPVNTAGAEDSPFFSPDGSRFVFVFVPDVRVPVDKQMQDCTVGLWQTVRQGDGWSEPARLLLSDDLALDGCPVIHGDTLWFCSVRAGNYREVDAYLATRQGDGWADWRNAGEQLNRERQIGEWHLSADGNTLYFGAERGGGFGGLDLYAMLRSGDGWGEPVNLGATVNDAGDQAMPCLSADGSELWFNSNSKLGSTGPATWRSQLQLDGSWGAAEEIVSNFAGEPNLDPDGNLYFVHHYMTDPAAGPIQIVEADIYLAKRR